MTWTSCCLLEGGLCNPLNQGPSNRTDKKKVRLVVPVPHIDLELRGQLLGKENMNGTELIKRSDERNSPWLGADGLATQLIGVGRKHKYKLNWVCWQVWQVWVIYLHEFVWGHQWVIERRINVNWRGFPAAACQMDCNTDGILNDPLKLHGILTLTGHEGEYSVHGYIARLPRSSCGREITTAASPHCSTWPERWEIKPTLAFSVGNRYWFISDTVKNPPLLSLALVVIREVS